VGPARERRHGVRPGAARPTGHGADLIRRPSFVGARLVGGLPSHRFFQCSGYLRCPGRLRRMRDEAADEISGLAKG
jgi:hypothetical protein